MLEEKETNEQNFEKPIIAVMPKRKLKKKFFIQFIFCIVSILFIIGCLIFYGNRLIKYYKIYNPKSEKGEKITLLSTSIMSTSKLVYEKDGLYKEANGYLYKGTNPNNYISFSGLTWRILKINNDGSIDLILNDSINILKWNDKISDYNDSDINKYLNEKFLSVLNKDLIINTVVCDDIINDISTVACSKVNSSNLVRLLNINEFLNSKVENSFISDGSNIWLVNRGNEKAWNINGNSVSYSSPSETYSIKPVITLKNSNILDKGKGTEEEPYVVKEKTNKYMVGKYVKLGGDVLTIYDIGKDNLKLTTSVLIDDIQPFNSEGNKYDLNDKNSIAYYLNNEYYETLSYKDLLQETEWYIGDYKSSYKDIYGKKISTKVGLLSVADMKFDNDLMGYYLLNGDGKKIYMYSDMLILSKASLSRAIRPAISIKKLNIVSGLGTKDKPYILEG